MFTVLNTAQCKVRSK